MAGLRSGGNVIPRASSEDDPRLGDLVAIMSLMANSDFHRQWSPKAVLNWIFPPVLHGQYVILRDTGKAVGTATWAFTDDAGQDALKRNSRPLTLAEWRSGKHIWVVDFIAPFGHARVLSRLLRTLAIDAGLADQTVHRIRRYADPPTEGL